ncbi:hypothetical protein MMEU_4482 [Mycobacterium marinum str. Europe]|nr:hypothetical protein MMEU_4482 [Mycobacterium marinum str. Europe]
MAVTDTDNHLTSPGNRHVMAPTLPDQTRAGQSRKSPTART